MRIRTTLYNKPNIPRRLRLIRAAKLVHNLSFVLFLPIAFMFIVLLHFPAPIVLIPVVIIFMGSGTYAQFARCPRCREPFEHKRMVEHDPYWRYKMPERRRRHPSACVHCGLPIKP